MTRRSTRKAATVPPGWTAHDGSGMPVPEHSCPGVIYRIGTRMAAGKTEARWHRDRAEDSWTWPTGSREPMDIVAYKAEPVGYVAIPRLED